MSLPPVKYSPFRILTLSAACLVVLAGCETTETGGTGPASMRRGWQQLPEKHRLDWEGHHVSVEITPSQWEFMDCDSYDQASTKRLQLIFLKDKESGTRFELYACRVGAGSGIGMEQIDSNIRNELKNEDGKLVKKETRTIGGIPWHYYLTEEKFNNRAVNNVRFETFYRGVYLDGLIWTYPDEGTLEDVKALADKVLAGMVVDRDGPTYWSPKVTVVDKLESAHFGIRYGDGTLPFFPVEVEPGENAYFDKLIVLGEHQGLFKSVPLLGDHRDLRWSALIDAFSPISGFSSQDIPERMRTEINDLPWPALKLGFSAAQAKGAAAWLVKAPGAACLFLFIPIDEQPSDAGEFERFIRTIDLAGAAQPREMESLPDWIKQPNGTMYAYLSAHYLGLGNIMKAEESAREAVAWNPDSAEVVMALANILLQSGKFADGIPVLTEFVAKHPDNLQVKRLLGLSHYLSEDPDQGRAVFREILSTGSAFDLWIREHFYQLHQAGRHADILVDVEEFQDVIGSAYDLWKGVASIAESGLEEGIPLLDKYLAENPGDADAHMIKVQVLMENGDNSGALKAAEAGYLATSNVDLLYMQGVAYNGLGNYGDARDVFRECLRINPSHASAQQLLSVVNSLIGETDYSLFENPIEPVEMPEEITREAGSFDLSDYEEFGAVAEWMGVAVSYVPGKSYRKTYYKKFHVLKETGIPELKETTYDFNPIHHRLYVNRLEVYDAAGNKVGEGKPSQYYTSDRGGDNIINGEKTLHIPIPNLQVGGSFEIVWSVEVLGNVESFPFESYTLGGLFPRHVCFVSAVGEPGNYQFTTGDHEIEQHDLGERTLWVSRQTDAFELKHFLPVYTAYMPTLWFTSATEEDWQALATNYAAEIAQYLEPREELEALALELSSPEASEEERLKAVAGYIGSNFTYKALAFGTRATIPNEPEVIIRNKFGDCKDLSLLSYHLLRALGMTVDLALVDTEMDLRTSVRSLDQFDHMVVIVDLPSGSQIYDPADKYMPALQAARTVPRATALRITGNGGETWFTAPDPLPANNRIKIRRSVDLNDEPFCLVTEEAVFTGLFGASFREEYSNYQSQDRVFAMQSLMAGSGIRVNIESVEYGNMENIQEPLRMTYSYRVRNPLLRGNGRSRIDIDSTWESTLLPLVGSDPDRRQAVYIHMPIAFDIETEVRLPAGMQVEAESLAPALDVSNDLGRIERTVERTGNGVRIAYRALLQSGEFPATTFPAIVELSEAVHETSRFSFEASR